MRCFDWITPEIAVGGCFDAREAARFAAEDGFAGVVDLRAEDRDDARLLRRHGLRFLHLPTTDLAAVDPRHLDEGVRFAAGLLDGGGRVLIHCQHGIGRSATLALCVMVDRGHPPLAALERMKTVRPRISPSPEQYEAWAAWLRTRPEAEAAWPVPDFSAFARIAYRHLHAGAPT
jgi:protein-tyrosine phosphatase